MESQHFTFTDGFIGSLGKDWNTPGPDEMEKIITGAMKIEIKTREQIVASLEAGQTVRWSMGFDYDGYRSYGICGRKRTAPPVQMVECDCGHSVPAGTRMMASIGSSCPDCYDRMSA